MQLTPFLNIKKDNTYQLVRVPRPKMGCHLRSKGGHTTQLLKILTNKVLIPHILSENPQQQSATE